MKVKCDFCQHEIEATKEAECSWQGEIPTGWICSACDNESEAAYQASCLSVDYYESQLAEME